jgi:hypothetical protein
VRDYLAAQKSAIALKSLSDFCAKNMSNIRDKSNFLKGIVRKNVEKESEIVRSGGVYNPLLPSY